MRPAAAPRPRPALTLRLVQLQRQPRLGRARFVQALQQLLVLPNHLRGLLVLTAKLLLKTRMNLTGFLQLLKHT